MWGTVADIVVVLVMAGVCLAGVVLTVAQLPGTWLVAVAAAACAWLGGPGLLTWRVVIVLAGLATVAEVVEFGSGAVLAQRGGASRRAAWYGLAGGLLGAFLLSVPVPLVGTVIGAVIGCFVGAFIAEMQEGRTLGDGARSGTYSAVGRALGSMIKVMAVVIMSSIVLVSMVMNLVR